MPQPTAGGAGVVDYLTGPLDLNGDGRGDVVLYRPVAGGGTSLLEDGSASRAFEPVLDESTTHDWSPGWQVNPGDVDGDGLVDLFLYDVTTGAWYVAFNAGGGWRYVSGTFSPGWTVRTGDFDGDGRADLFLYDVVSGAWFQSLADGAGGWTHLAGLWSPGWEMHVTRVDLDARADLLLYNPVSGAYLQTISTGPGAFAYAGGTWGGGYRIVASGP